MKLFIKAIYLFFFLFVFQQINGQSTMKNKWYAEINIFQSTSDFDGIQRMMRYESPSLIRGIEIGRYVGKKIGIHAGYLNKSEHSYFQGGTILIEQNLLGHGYYVGADLLVFDRNLWAFTVGVNGIYDKRKGESFTSGGIIPGSSRSLVEIKSIGVMPTLQFELKVTRVFHIVLNSGFSYGNRTSRIETIQIYESIPRYFSDSYLDWLYLNKLGVKFVF